MGLDHTKSSTFPQRRMLPDARIRYRRFSSQRTAIIAESLTLAIFCGFLFFYGLGSFGLVGADEPRYAQIAREMLARHDWVTPILNGTAWLEKPVLYYWGAMLSYKLFGVSDWAARVPSAVMATLLVFSVYLFLRRFRPGSQLDGALIVAASAAVIGFARAASTDMPLRRCLGSHCCPGTPGWRPTETLAGDLLLRPGVGDFGQGTGRAVPGIADCRGFLRARCATSKYWPACYGCRESQSISW